MMNNISTLLISFLLLPMSSSEKEMHAVSLSSSQSVELFICWIIYFFINLISDMWFENMFSFFLYLCFYLAEWQRDTFNPLAASQRDHSGQDWGKPESRNPQGLSCQVPGVQTFESSFTAFPCTSAGSWAGSSTAGTQASIPTCNEWKHLRWWASTLCHKASPFS